MNEQVIKLKHSEIELIQILKHESVKRFPGANYAILGAMKAGMGEVLSNPQKYFAALSSPPAKEPLTDEQLQKDIIKAEAEALYPDIPLYEAQYPCSEWEITAGKRTAHIAAATPLQALLKEKEQEIERLDALAKTLQEGVDVYFKQNHQARKQLTELKEEIERLRGKSIISQKTESNEEYELRCWEVAKKYPVNLVNGVDINESARHEYYWVTKYKRQVERLEAELTDLRALHTQQMREAWDASEAYLYFTEGPGPYAPDKSTYISKITGQ